MRASENRPEAIGEGLFHLGRFPDFGRGNPPVVAPLVGAIPLWLPRLGVAKRVSTGARTLPEVEGSPVN